MDDMQGLLRKMLEQEGGIPGLTLAPGLFGESLSGGAEPSASQKMSDGQVDQIVDDDDFLGRRYVSLSGDEVKCLPLLKERARIFASRSKYYEAISVVEDIEEEEDIEEFGMKLLMAECYLQLGRENKANKWVRELKSALLEDPSLEAEEVFKLLEELVESKCFTRALILLPIVCELFKRIKPDDALEGIFRSIKQGTDCNKPMILKGGRDRVLAIDFGVEYTARLLKDLQQIDVDAKKRAFKQSVATNWVSYDFWLLNENLKGIKLREDAVAAMDEAFGPQVAKQRHIYGNNLYNIGVGYDILSKHADAKVAYTRAIDALESATDFDEELTRLREIEMCKQKLKELYK